MDSPHCPLGYDTSHFQGSAPERVSVFRSMCYPYFTRDKKKRYHCHYTSVAQPQEYYSCVPRPMFNINVYAMLQSQRHGILSCWTYCDGIIHLGFHHLCKHHILHWLHEEVFPYATSHSQAIIWEILLESKFVVTVKIVETLNNLSTVLR